MAGSNLPDVRSRELSGLFEGWTCSPREGVLYDSGSNHYGLDEIRSIFYLRELVTELTGGNEARTVESLKLHLAAKIEATRTPRIAIIWGDGEIQTLMHPVYPSPWKGWPKT